MRNLIVILLFFLAGCASRPFSEENEVAQKELDEYLVGLSTLIEIEKALKEKRFNCKKVGASQVECKTERVVAPLVCSNEGWLVKLEHHEGQVINKTVKYQYPACL